MSPEELEKLIKQHGEAAQTYANEAIQIGDTYIILNFGFDATMHNEEAKSLYKYSVN
ncbi:hypothetical protein I8752_07340 [Nostocaceae cyanobacterium CENA369]|uniref:Uncharacterized protein n=1 Tax=Dendronalium phyllosphericum CENA369 TaxID=1725256 RepID=A0A8J7LEA5_9NOST|nr:hypothetical protein [Dendronalium phyllosphericum]MBH8572833.1 hypothetical protein [Dendronalium phyllosphericum CENA369]